VYVMTSMNKSEENDDEISIKELLLKLGDWRRYFFHSWKWIILGGIVGAGLGLTYSLIKKKTYVATLTFVLGEAKGSGLGAYAGIASQFGVDLGSMGEGSGIFSGDNVMEFLKSRLMTEEVLLSEITWEGKKECLGDLYIEAYKLKDGWQSRPELADFKLPVNADPDSLTRLQDSVITLLHLALQKSNLNITKTDKKLNFISVETKSVSETFSKFFTERLAAKATKFYVDTKVQSSATTVSRLQNQADSILRELNQKTYSAAIGQDMNLNPARHVTTVDQELESRDKTVLLTMYAEIVKNLELAKMTLFQETPILQIVDRPRFPLKVNKLRKALGILGGGFIGGFLTLVILTFRRIYKQLMTG
jgi:hypothetical protein